MRPGSDPACTRSGAAGATRGASGGRLCCVARGVQPVTTHAVISTDVIDRPGVEWRRLSAEGTIGQRRIGRTGDGEAHESDQTGRMRPAGFLSERQRRFAWLGFLLAAFQAPVAATLIDDASWLFAVVVSLLVATVILADDAARRRPETVE